MNIVHSSRRETIRRNIHPHSALANTFTWNGRRKRASILRGVNEEGKLFALHEVNEWEDGSTVWIVTLA